MDKTTFARHLRQQQTPDEERLWRLLRNRATGYKFRRQVPRGPYVLDFVCLSARLVIELDGSQHADAPRDALRDAWLAERGFRVLRLWNQDLRRDPEATLHTITEALGQTLPLP